MTGLTPELAAAEAESQSAVIQAEEEYHIADRQSNLETRERLEKEAETREPIKPSALVDDPTVFNQPSEVE